MGYIFRDGYTIERENGEKITLTGDEIMSIHKAIYAYNGKGSVEYFLNYGDEVQEVLEAAQEMLKYDNWCADVWDEYMEAITWDSGEDEYNSVLMVVREFMNEKEKERNND